MSHNAIIFWCTGLSGAGKTTICNAIMAELETLGFKVLALDGDDVRNRLHCHLSFSEADIKENNRLISSLCKDMRGEYDAIFVPIISPYRISRAKARELLSPGFYEVYFAASLDAVAGRDVKGLYAKAFKGEIKDMIGVAETNPYEPPENPDISLDTVGISSAETIKIMRDFVLAKLRENK